MNQIRPSAVAGLFYPASKHQLQDEVQAYLKQAQQIDSPQRPIRAIIAPHAGYQYSGPIAASVYRMVAERCANVTHVILLGPAHRVAFRGIAAPSVDQFMTPLGPIDLDRENIKSLEKFSFVHVSDLPHQEEHSLEVHLPFLQTVLSNFQLTPLVVGDCRPDQVHQVLDTFWNQTDNLIVISSDLSHFHDYTTAQRMDQATSHAIETLAYDKLDYDHACGRTPVQGVLLLAKEHGLTVQTVDLRNSGDTAGTKDRVVGYGAYVIS